MYRHHARINVYLQNAVLNGRNQQLLCVPILFHRIHIIRARFVNLHKLAQRFPLIRHNLHPIEVAGIIFILLQRNRSSIGNQNPPIFIQLRHIDVIDFLYRQQNHIFLICHLLNVKKLLLAESAAAVANAVYALAPESLGMGLAWLGAVSYCLQIFFDFSGYSDMAIGIGALFGFTFPENFNYPYISGSVSEFWRRWHMTLNRWFVDYLYIPLGGSRCGKWKTIRNKLIVFFCTGLWHGAGWTYILWGLWHGVLVSAEGLCKAPLEKLRRSRGGRAAMHIYTLLAVILGFAMFRAPSVQQGFLLIGRMFSFAGAGAAGLLAAESILTGSRIAALAAGIVLSLPVVPALTRRLTGKGWEIVWDILALFGLLLAILALSGGGFTPFIYQQF